MVNNRLRSMKTKPKTIRPAPVDDDVFVFPATAGQLGFWYLDKIQPGNPAYNIAIRFRLQGPLQVEALEQALNEIVRRHESLRTVFAERDGVAVQVVCSQSYMTLKFDDLRSVAARDRHERAEKIAVEEGRRPFSLANGPLFRARLLRLENEEHVLLLTIHHIVADGWSLNVISRELCELYGASCSHRRPDLEDLRVQYGDFSIWQEQWLNSPALDKQLSYWTKQLRALPILEIPTDRPRPPVPTSNGEIESILLPRELTNKLEALAHKEKVTPYVVTLASLQMLLQRRTGLDDIAVGTVHAGRARVELEPLIGMFINSLILRSDLSGDPTFSQLLERTQETVLEAFANHDVPFARVVESVQPRRDPSRHPLFQINFMHQRAFLPEMRSADLTMTPIPSVSPGSIYDLNFFIVERAEGWRVSCEYNTDLYDAATAHRLVEQFRGLLDEIATDSTYPISRYRLTSRPVPVSFDSTKLGVISAKQKSDDRYQGPRDATEARLVQLWEKALGQNRVSIDADFFDLGGHSLLAARLLAQIGQEFGQVLPFATFLQAPTIKSFAARLRAPVEIAVSDQIHTIKPGGPFPPLVVLTSQPQLYRSLAQLMHPSQPILGITSPDHATLGDGFTLEDVASNLVKALRTVLPHGPYYLGGWCVSGVIAYEMARQLQAQGEKVALLALLDSYCPLYIRRFRTRRAIPIRWYFTLEKYSRHLNVIRRRRVTEIPTYLGRGIRSIMSRWRARIRSAFQPKRDLTPEDQLQRFSAILRRTAIDYDPQPTTVPLALFRSEVSHTGLFRDITLGWTPFARGGLTLYELPGDHDEMFREPVVELLAKNLTEALERAAQSVGESNPHGTSALVEGV